MLRTDADPKDPIYYLLYTGDLHTNLQSSWLNFHFYGTMKKINGKEKAMKPKFQPTVTRTHQSQQCEMRAPIQGGSSVERAQGNTPPSTADTKTRVRTFVRQHDGLFRRLA